MKCPKRNSISCVLNHLYMNVANNTDPNSRLLGVLPFCISPRASFILGLLIRRALPSSMIVVEGTLFSTSHTPQQLLAISLGGIRNRGPPRNITGITESGKDSQPLRKTWSHLFNSTITINTKNWNSWISTQKKSLRYDQTARMRSNLKWHTHEKRPIKVSKLPKKTVGFSSTSEKTDMIDSGKYPGCDQHPLFSIQIRFCWPLRFS